MTWTCPLCGARVPVDSDVTRTVPSRVTVTTTEKSWADFYAHVWQHADH